jgi:methylglutaconyl-CoA hydratase
MSGETQADGPPVLSMLESVATIRLNRPSQHNRIDPEDLAPIRSFIAEVASNPSIIALVFTGTGARTFSSGYTLSRVGANFDDSFEKMLNDVEQCPVPTICALNGSVYGGSTDLALCCDIRIGVRGSRMFMPAARIGMHYYPDGIRRYVRELGPSIAKYLFLTAMPLADVDMLVGRANLPERAFV